MEVALSTEQSTQGFFIVKKLYIVHYLDYFLGVKLFSNASMRFPLFLPMITGISL